MSTCPDCGARLPTGATCQSIFDEFLVLEFTHPTFGAVHQLTVPCFMVQHGRYTDEAVAWVVATLRAVLAGEMTVAQMRQSARRSAQPGRGDWKVVRPPGAPPAARVAWTMTIADVARGYTDADSYCRLVERWARSVVAQAGQSAAR